MNKDKKYLRILCLHGRGQNMDIFRQKTGQLRKRLKNYAVFEYINAPNTIHTEVTLGTEDIDKRVWWYRSSDKEMESVVITNVSNGFEESLRHLENVLKQNGPFDGILGFSEGAAFLGLVYSMKERFYDHIKFLILIAGCKSRDSIHESVYSSNKIKIPSLHVIGENDAIITPSRSKELMELFENAEVIFHPGQHFVPASKDIKEKYITFLNKFINN